MSVLDRLNEPSTHAGISGIFAGLASIFPQWAQYFAIGSGVFGAIAAAKADPSKQQVQ